MTYALSDRAVTEASVRPGEAVDLTTPMARREPGTSMPTGAARWPCAVTDGKITGGGRYRQVRSLHRRQALPRRGAVGRL